MMIVGKLLTGCLSDSMGPGRMCLGTRLIAAGSLPRLIHAANVAWLLPGFGFIYGAMTICLSESCPAAVGTKWLPRLAEVRKVSGPEWSAETP